MSDKARDWTAGLIAFKWADTLSEAEQSELLTSSLRRLQNAINVAARADLARKVLEAIDANPRLSLVTKSEVCAVLRELFQKEGIELE